VSTRPGRTSRTKASLLLREITCSEIDPPPSQLGIGLRHVPAPKRTATDFDGASQFQHRPQPERPRYGTRTDALADCLLPPEANRARRQVPRVLGDRHGAVPREPLRGLPAAGSPAGPAHAKTFRRSRRGRSRPPLAVAVPGPAWQKYRPDRTKTVAQGHSWESAENAGTRRSSAQCLPGGAAQPLIQRSGRSASKTGRFVPAGIHEAGEISNRYPDVLADFDVRDAPFGDDPADEPG